MNKKIIYKAVIIAIVITIFSLLVTTWLDYKKDKEYEAKQSEMIQSANKEKYDTSLIKLEIDDSTISNKGLTLVITDNNKPAGSWGPGYEIMKLENEDHWITLKPNEDVAFNEIAYVLDENNQWHYKVDWTNFYGELETGTYKIKKSVYNNGYVDLYSNQFVIE